ncbi:hypothetical protein LCGC14_0622350, partial [marine sediment metagenome]
KKKVNKRGIVGAAKLIPSFGSKHYKVFPQHLAGMIGLPSVGNIWYVDPGKTSGVSGGGTTREDAFITVLEAFNAATADQDDVILITPSSSTGGTSEAASINWSKRRTCCNSPCSRSEINSCTSSAKRS